MESSNSTKNEEEDSFLDALDEFPSFDCFLTDLQSDHSSVSDPEPTPIHHPPEPSPKSPSPRSTLRRRRSSGADPKDLNSESPALSRARKYRLQRRLNEKEKEIENERLDSNQGQQSSVGPPRGGSGEPEKEEESTVTTAREDGPVRDSADSAEFGESSSNLLELIAVFVIKAIGFQINLIVTFFTFPFWLLCKSYMFATDPFRMTRIATNYVMGKSMRVRNLIFGSLNSLFSDWFREHKSIWDLLLRYGLGLLWSAYVWFVLCGLLVCSFLVSGMLIRYLVEEPIHVKEVLNFDYTKNSPEAFMVVTTCANSGCGVKCKEISDIWTGGAFHIPYSHKLQATVTLALPESEYNRKLGMFQVRVDFLSANGTALSSSSQPCILLFKSEPIRLFSTFFKAAPLIAGYLSESQTLKLKFKGFSEGYIPTACIKVIIEQRAEYRPGAGIPELYDASLILESELPLFRRILWYWKKTVFIWISIMAFSMELLLAVICCRPLIIPRSRTRGAADGNFGTRNGLQPPS